MTGNGHQIRLNEVVEPTRTASAMLRATFSRPEDMQRAIDELEVNGFDRAEITVVEGVEAQDTLTEGNTTAPYNEQDARQARTLHASGAATVAALAGAGVTIATGGVAAAAVAVAVAAGAAVGGVTHVASTAANSASQADREVTAADGTLALSVQATTAEKQAKGEGILRRAGATRVTVV